MVSWHAFLRMLRGSTWRQVTGARSLTREAPRGCRRDRRRDTPVLPHSVACGSATIVAPAVRGGVHRCVDWRRAVDVDDEGAAANVPTDGRAAPARLRASSERDTAQAGAPAVSNTTTPGRRLSGSGHPRPFVEVGRPREVCARRGSRARSLEPGSSYGLRPLSCDLLGGRPVARSSPTLAGGLTRNDG